MPRYVFLTTATEQGRKEPKELVEGVQAARGVIEKMGGKLLDWYLTMGEYDAISICEFPNDNTAAAFALASGSKGNVRTCTLKAFTLAEATEIISKIP